MKPLFIKTVFLILFVLLLFTLPVFTQQISLPYFCGFETQEEMDGWVFVNSSNSTRWHVGNATSFKGEKSLYVSPDGGQSPGYNKNACVVAVYKEFDLPGGIYDVSFDWKAAGTEREMADLVYVCWIEDPQDPEDPDIQIIANNTGIFSSDYKGKEKTSLYSYAAWRNRSFQVRGGVKAKLVFFWKNDAKTTPYDFIHNPAGCIDNLQIARANICGRPTNFKVQLDNTKENILFNWTGSADSYDLIYKNMLTDDWDTIPQVVGNTYTMPSLPVGSYAFWLRGICSNDTSMWIPFYYLPIIDFHNICVDFTNLQSPSVIGTTGVYTGSGVPPNQNYAYATREIVDYGEESAQSRHTINTTYGQYDAQTGYGLRTIPPGEFTSVRLGNWASGSQGESLSFIYPVDSTSSILLLKYAVVLEDPTHPEKEQPQFLLEILDQYDNLLDPDCGKVYFFAKVGTPGWNNYSRSSSINIVWKDWTTMGINLSQYMGQRIKIRLSTFDCSQGAHYGYAYFSMNCIPAEFTGLACGSNHTESVGAPPGFNYEWFDSADPSHIIGTDRELNIAGLDADAIYTCRLISLEDSDCTFEMSASMIPLIPAAEVDYQIIRRNCENRVKFTNNSFVYTIQGRTSRPIENFYWDFGNGQISHEENPADVLYTAPGEYTVSLRAGLNDFECDSIWTEKINILPIGPSNDTIKVFICDGEEYMFGSRPLFETNKYTTTFQSKEGCDSVVTIDLTVYERFDVLMTDTICFGETYDFNGQPISQSGSFTKTLPSIHGCDSIIRLRLVVLPEVKFTLYSLPERRGNDGEILIRNATFNYTYSINGVMDGSLQNLSAGEYTIVLYNVKNCLSESVTITIERECLQMQIENTQSSFCPEIEEIHVPYTVSKGFFEKYVIHYGETEIKAGFHNTGEEFIANGAEIVIAVPRNVRPGHYVADIIATEQLCNIEPISFNFTILYSSSIQAQRWNNIIFIKNSDYNGGYEFSSYQWYKNDTEIAGETRSYLQVREGLDINALYRVELTRSDDNVRVSTCPFVPQVIENVSLTLVSNMSTEGENFQLNSPTNGKAAIYNINGFLIAEQVITEGHNQLKPPKEAGYYILKVELDNEQTQVYHIKVIR